METAKTQKEAPLGGSSDRQIREGLRISRKKRVGCGAGSRRPSLCKVYRQRARTWGNLPSLPQFGLRESRQSCRAEDKGFARSARGQTSLFLSSAMTSRPAKLPSQEKKETWRPLKHITIGSHAKKKFCKAALLTQKIQRKIYSLVSALFESYSSNKISEGSFLSKKAPSAPFSFCLRYSS